MKKLILFSLFVLVLSAFTGVSSLQADVIENEIIYIDVGYNVDMDINLFNEVDYITKISIFSLGIQWVFVKLGEPFRNKQLRRIAENRKSFEELHSRVVPWRDFNFNSIYIKNFGLIHL